MFINPLVAKLKVGLYLTDEKRISGLGSALKSFKLTPKQKVQLSGFKDEAVDTLKVYMRAWHATHYAQALEYINLLDEEVDVHKQLLLMLELHRKMYSESSDKLYKGLTTLLLNALEILSPKPRIQLETMRRSDAAVRSMEDVDTKDNSSFMHRFKRM
jgi:hypothetical protein